MKLIVKKFSAQEIDLAANINSWSNKPVAEFLNKVINPKDADTKIFRLKPEQQKEIKEKLGSEAKMPASFKEIYQQFKSSKIQDSESNKSIALGSPEKYWRGDKSSNGPGAPTDYKVLVTPSGFSTSTGTKCKINNTVKKATEALTGLDYSLKCNTRISIRDWGKGASVTVTILDSSKKNPSAQIYLQEYSKDSELDVFAPGSNKFSFKSPGSINKRIAWDEFYKIMRPFFSEVFKMQF